MGSSILWFPMPLLAFHLIAFFEKREFSVLPRTKFAAISLADQNPVTGQNRSDFRRCSFYFALALTGKVYRLDHQVSITE